MLAWQEIDTVLLDMDGTLIDLHFDNYFWQRLVPERWGQERGMPLDDAQRELEPIFAAVAGTLNWYCTDYWRSPPRPAGGPPRGPFSMPSAYPTARCFYSPMLIRIVWP